MKTPQGKLVLLGMILMIGLLMLAPMRSGIEDQLIASSTEVCLQPGESVSVSYQLIAEMTQTVAYHSEDSGIATVNQMGLITAVSPGNTVVRLQAQGGTTAQVRVRVEGVPVTSFSLNAHAVEMDKGDVSGLAYQFNRGAVEQTVSWMSENSDVVRVDDAGRLTAVGAGEARVIATTSGGLTDCALIRVSVHSTSVQIEPEALTLGVGAAMQLEVRCLPLDSTDCVTGWTSSRSDVVSVDDAGNICAVSVGTATVTAQTKDGLQASVTVEVEPAGSDFRLDPAQLTMQRGEVQTLQARFADEGGWAQTHYVQWESSDPSVAAVENGVVTAIKTGKAIITAKADGFEEQCEITVQTGVTEIQLNVTEQTLEIGQGLEPFQIYAKVLPVDADNVRLKYSSDNELVATVSQSGLVTLTGGCGTATIDVQAQSGACAQCVVHVVSAQ